MTWEEEIGTPAEKANEGQRSLIDAKFAKVSYEIAPLDKGFAVRTECCYLCGDRHTCWVPWRRFDSRDECLGFVMEQAKIHFEYPVVFPEQKQAQEAVLQMLAGMEGIAEADLGDRPSAKSHVARVKRPHEKPGQGLLF